MKWILQPLMRTFVILVSSALFLGLTVKYTTLEEITTGSNLIITGKVKSSHSVWEDKNIYTYYTIELDEIIKGQNTGNTVVVKQLGGRVGDIMQHIAGTPKLKENSEALLFLVNWKDAYWIHSIVLGYYEIIEKDGSSYAFNNFNNVHFVDAKTGRDLDRNNHPKTEYELSSLKSDLRNFVKKAQE